MKKDKVDQGVIKEYNKKKIINLLKKSNGMTKRNIAKRIGVSLPTVISNVNELIREGIVEEAGLADSTGGRKPVVVRFLENSKYSFGVDFLIDSIRIILTNLNSEIIEDITFKLWKTTSLTDTMNEISFRVNEMMEANNIQEENVLGIGFSLPGTVNEKQLILEVAPNLGLEDIDFSQFKSLFGFPMFVENEANAAAYAELRLGVAREMSNLVYISIMKGVGTGIIIQSQLYKGNNKRAGEFGHMTIQPGGRKCICGKQGCWNAYVSENGLINAYNELTGYNIKTLAEFIQCLKKGNKTAKAEWDKYIDYLAIGIQNILFSLDPHYIILGGSIANYEDIFLDSLRERVFKDINFFKPDDVKILVSKLRESSSIIGASLLPLESFFYIDDKIIYKI
ncbi:MAG: ROK family protein [Acetivibrionales bacterium]